MRTKAVPEPVSMDALRAAQSSVPLVPDSTDDCCRRLERSGPATTRDSAREWLPFLAALGLVTDTDRGYQRERVDPGDAPLADRFRESVYGVEESITAVEAGARSSDAVFEATSSLVPTWERQRDPDWESRWRTRTERLLAWAVVFDVLAERDGTYVTA